MKDLLEKYTQLSDDHQKEVIDFINFLLNKQVKASVFDLQAYQQEIQAVSVWSEDDLAPILEAKQNINSWKSTEW
ncbi:DUF2281 domain-containing protein [Larkinella bovis]|uniref:DUF2281 domain-containing protein n=1 Tax=Larkinella bovis TaxID=683041 RepID=A0ABW0ICU8_9BACT